MTTESKPDHVGGFSDFYGNPIKRHSRDLPYSGGRERHRDDLMPYQGLDAGYSLSSFDPGDLDPYVLYNRWGKIVKEWPEGYEPDREEIRQAVYNDMRKEGRIVG